MKLDPRRFFTAEQKQEKLSHHEAIDGKHCCSGSWHGFYANELAMDHILAWAKGGRAELSNAQLLCRVCNTDKGSGSL